MTSVEAATTVEPRLESHEPSREPWAARIVHGTENAFAITALGLMALLPIADIVGSRYLGRGVPAAPRLVQHLTLAVAFIGAMIAARQRRHLALATGSMFSGRVRYFTSLFASAVAASVTAVLAWTAVAVVRADAESTSMLGFGIPQWVAELVIPIGFAAVALRMWWQAGSLPAHEGSSEGAAATRLPSRQAWMRRAAVLVVLAAVWGMSYMPETSVGAWRWPLVIALLAGTIAGAPIFVTLGGLATILFFTAPDVGPVSNIPGEAYRIVASETLPTIPLFTLAGALLAEGGTPARLVRLFRALAGWLPGGTAVAAVLVCAFFTTFTGASGVTILALGGLLLPVLLRDVYRGRFSLGLVTASGSIGLLFPPSLPVIIYGVQAHIAVTDMFVACIVPGFVLVTLVSLYCMREALSQRAGITRPDPREMVAAIWGAKWEIGLPVVVLVSLFGGFATTVEAAALTVAYAFLVKFVFVRDARILGDGPRVLLESVVLVGGVLIIVGCALGLTNYLTLADVPMRGTEWVSSVVHSKWLFLLVLNFFLLIVGCLMDVFSAIIVVLPLIQPIAATFGVDPFHLGAIFLINLELGYLTPPVGLNLFLASYRFRKPMSEVTRAVLPFLAVQAASVLLVTYVPALSSGIAHWWVGG
jgi:C4-dicarboxylate transporter DctM subunit